MSRENGTGADGRHAHALHLNTTEPTPHVRVLSVYGDIDMVTASRFRTAVLAELVAAPARLVVDLTGVGFMGSNGLAVLLEALEETNTASIELRVVASTHAVLRPMWITGVSSIVDVRETLSDAVGA